jgi:Spy/CpxP family protein refolding chaperone
MKGTILLVTALTLAGVVQAGAQANPLIIVDGVVQPNQGPQPDPHGPGDPFARFLFPPELVMEHQGEIAITDAQRATLTTAVQQAQSKIVETQFKLSAEGEKMARLIQGARGARTMPWTIDEGQALEQVDRILSLEREMKRAQMTLLVRIKNALTPEQQMKLMQLRQQPK